MGEALRCRAWGGARAQSHFVSGKQTGRAPPSIEPRTHRAPNLGITLLVNAIPLAIAVRVLLAAMFPVPPSGLRVWPATGFRGRSLLRDNSRRAFPHGARFVSVNSKTAGRNGKTLPPRHVADSVLAATAERPAANGESGRGRVVRGRRDTGDYRIADERKPASMIRRPSPVVIEVRAADDESVRIPVRDPRGTNRIRRARSRVAHARSLEDESGISRPRLHRVHAAQPPSHSLCSRRGLRRRRSRCVTLRGGGRG